MKKVLHAASFVIAIALLICSIILLILRAGVLIADNREYFRPDYEKVDLSDILDKTELTDEDYELIYRQTGLAKIAVCDLLEKGDKDSIAEMQEQFFSDIDYQCSNWSMFSYIECLESHIKLADLQDGDILISSSTHISSWRCGHAAIVVDAKKGLILNAVRAGSLSEISGISDFTDRASVMVLRPKLDKETRESVAEYARNNLVGIPYSSTVGILSPKYEETIKTTQCSHLVWYAYKKFGIDIDSDGSGLVTPKDIAHSEYLDIVQIYGFDPDNLWK